MYFLPLIFCSHDFIRVSCFPKHGKCTYPLFPLDLTTLKILDEASIETWMRKIEISCNIMFEICLFVTSPINLFTEKIVSRQFLVLFNLKTRDSPGVGPRDPFPSPCHGVTVPPGGCLEVAAAGTR